jgi:plastocyanin
MPKLVLLAAAMTAAPALSACGGSSSSSTSSAPASSTAAGGSAGSLSIAADPSELAFTKKTLSAKAGTVQIAFTNNASFAHNFTLQKGTNGAQVGATPTFTGGTKTLSVKLAPGTYTIFCSVPGHDRPGCRARSRSSNRDRAPGGAQLRRVTSGSSRAMTSK